ncbi:unnamed protein product [Candidula unifasciata]|uniref:CABIT domain-containing protein n=1 Tax=Candidula unifasciata TaxID=100452 RepID=A0A8S3YKL6_9EUPU|nr:unnamed protein product [Candidula unifasciata]
MASPENQPLGVQSSPVLSTAVPEWSSEPVLLKDFASKRQVPGFAKVVKGTYMTLGSNKFSFQKQHHEVFIHSVKVGVKVLAHCLRRMEATGILRRGGHNVYATTRLYALDQRLAIPISYQGWFELLSEDGKSARPITSVMELAKFNPERCLVRENMKAYLMGDDGRLTFDKFRVLLAGEQIILNGELTLPSPGENKKVKMLRCLDSKGEIIFLGFDQSGMFTPIAGENDFAGVFNIRDVVKRFRLPLTVKLVQGVRPKVDPSRFTGLIRLDWVYTDETAFVCPVEKNHVRLLPVPVDVNLQVVSALNEQEIKSTELYRSMMMRCNRMISNYNNTLHLIVQIPDVVASRGKNRSSNMFSIPFQSETLGPSSARAKSREMRLMDEIDDLYAYVRDGGAPPTKSKFTYDSDEESYWEEPAYEPLDDFRARLRALEAGERVNYHSKYQPKDPRHLILDSEHDLRNGTMNGSPKVLRVQQDSITSQVPPLPPRPLDLPSNPPQSFSATITSPSVDIEDEDKTPTNKVAPEMLGKQQMRNDGDITTVYNLGLVSSQSTLGISPKPTQIPQEAVQRSKTFYYTKTSGPQTSKKDRLVVSKKESPDSSNSGSSGNGHRNHIARDFKDSDISSLAKGGSSGSSGRGPSNVRKKIQTMYL